MTIITDIFSYVRSYHTLTNFQGSHKFENFVDEITFRNFFNSLILEYYHQLIFSLNINENKIVKK